MSFASRTASSSSRNGITAATGPKISSRAGAVVVVDRAQDRRREPEARAVRRAFRGSPPGRRPARTTTRSRAAPPRSAAPSRLASSSGSPTLIASTASSSTSMKRSIAERSTRIRERAQQSWPALPNTALGAACGGALEVGVREHDVRRLAAQLERHALDRLGGARGDAAAHLGGAGEPDLRDVRVLHEPLPAHRAGPRHHVHHALRDAGLERDPLELERRERRELGGLQDDRVAGGQRRRRASRTRS